MPIEDSMHDELPVAQTGAYTSCEFCRLIVNLSDVSDKVVLETALSSMVSASSATERIVNTPMPFSVLCHLRSRPLYVAPEFVLPR